MARLTTSEIESLDSAGLRLAFTIPEAAASLRAYFGPTHADVLAASLAREALAPFANGAGRTVLLLPGFLGSGLVDHGRLVDDLVWVDLFQLTLLDGLQRLELNEDGGRDRVPGARILPGRPLRLFYELLGAHLSVRGGFRVEPVAFDWRRRIDESARALHQRIELLTTGDPQGQVSVVAHSMGCLVCKRYFQLYPGEAGRRIDHAVFIAPPLHGTFATAELLAGDHAMVRRFGAFSPPLRDRLLQVFRTFPGLYELLPEPARFGCEALFDAARWEPGRIVERLLNEGREAGERLREPHELMQRTSIVLSAALPTTAGVTFDQGKPSFHRVASGDGTVLVASAWDEGAAGCFEALGEHNTLPLLPEVREGTLRLLQTRGKHGGPLPKLARPEDAQVGALGASLRASPAREVAASLALRERISAGAVSGADVFWMLGAGPVPEPQALEASEAVASPLEPVAPDAAAPEGAEARRAAVPVRRRTASGLTPEQVEKLYAAFAPRDAAPLTDAAFRLLDRSSADASRRFAPAGLAAQSSALCAPGDAVRSKAAMATESALLDDVVAEIGLWILEALDYHVVDPGEPPPLSKAQVQTIADIYQFAPEAIEIVLAIALQYSLASEEGVDGEAAARQALQEATAFFSAPDPVQWLENRNAQLEAQPPPAGLTFNGYDPTGIPVQPASTRFHPLEDLLGWLVYAAAPAIRYHLAGAGIAPYRTHDTVNSRFDYPLTPKIPGAPISVAVLGDFATGSYVSKYIARRVVSGGFDCAVHLGDVYYAGRRTELNKGLRAPLAPMLGQTGLYLLPGNHEMYSGGYPLMEYIDEKRNAYPNVQRQEGPYFRLYSDHFQIIGVDTEWGNHGGLSAQQKQWLGQVLAQGKANGRINILMSSNEPYSYGDAAFTSLLTDVLGSVGGGDISAWFWGNTHYFTLFRRSAGTPFIGCCAGNGGYPYKRLRDALPCPVVPEFREAEGRFSGTFDSLSNRGNNGYCELTLGPGYAMKIVYRDWKGVARCTRNLVWHATERRLDFI